MADTKAAAAGAPEKAAETVETESSLLDQIVQTASIGADDKQKEGRRDMVREFVAQVLQGEMTVSRDTEAMINARIAQLDHLLSIQLAEVMHNPEFQKLEATWRGLQYLIKNSECTPMLKIRVLNVTKKELGRDLQRANEFDQSAIFKKVYEEEYGVFGGEPFAAILGDYEFGKGFEDLELLDNMSHVAAAAHAPFLTSASANLFSLDSFTKLGEPRDLGKIFDSLEYAKWKGFRMSEDSRYVGLCVPHILMRVPYGKETRTVEAFDYEEGVDGSEHSKYLWGNAAYALATRLTNAFSLYGWCAAIRGVEGGGLVEGLPTHAFRTDDGDIALKCPTEIAHHRPARKGAVRSGIDSAGALQGHRLCRVFRVQSAQTGASVRSGIGQCQRAALDAVALHLRGVALCPLSEVDDARQDRLLHVAQRLREFPEPLDHELCRRQR